MSDLNSSNSDQVSDNSYSSPALNNVNATSKIKKKVLIVEDEQDASAILKMNLESTGEFEIYEAKNGKEGLEVQAREFCELILLDIIMPVMDGVEALKELREHPEKYGKPMIYVLTNLTGEMAEESVKKYNADGFIVKVTNEPDDVVNIVRDAFSKFEKKSRSLPALESSVTSTS